VAKRGLVSRASGAARMFQGTIGLPMRAGTGARSKGPLTIRAIASGGYCGQSRCKGTFSMGQDI
jgi:hypothetical protein